MRIGGIDMVDSFGNGLVTISYILVVVYLTAIFSYVWVESNLKKLEKVAIKDDQENI